MTVTRREVKTMKELVNKDIVDSEVCRFFVRDKKTGEKRYTRIFITTPYMCSNSFCILVKEIFKEYRCCHRWDNCDEKKWIEHLKGETPEVVDRILDVAQEVDEGVKKPKENESKKQLLIGIYNEF